MPTADEAKVLRNLFDAANSVYWDPEKEVIVFG